MSDNIYTSAGVVGNSRKYFLFHKSTCSSCRKLKLLKNSHTIVNIANICRMPFQSMNILFQFLEKLGFIRFPQKATGISQRQEKIFESFLLGFWECVEKVWFER